MVVMMASTCVFAQHAPGSLTLQARAGAIGADFSNTSDTQIRVGLVVGPEFEYTMSDFVSLAFGLNYSQQGADQDKLNVTYKLDYLTVPIMANVYLLKGLAFKAGIQPGYNVSSKVEAGGKNADIDENALKKFDLSIPVGISYEFCNFVIDTRFTFGTTKIFDTKYINLNSKNFTLQLSLGYKFTLF